MNDGRYNDIYSVEEANKMVLRGIPFRDAYRIVAGKSGSGTFEPTTPSDYTHTGSIGNTGCRLIYTRLEHEMKAFKTGYSPEELHDSIKNYSLQTTPARQ